MEKLIIYIFSILIIGLTVYTVYLYGKENFKPLEKSVKTLMGSIPFPVISRKKGDGAEEKNSWEVKAFLKKENGDMTELGRAEKICPSFFRISEDATGEVHFGIGSDKSCKLIIPELAADVDGKIAFIRYDYKKEKYYLWTKDNNCYEINGDNIELGNGIVITFRRLDEGEEKQ